MSGRLQNRMQVNMTTRFVVWSTAQRSMSSSQGAGTPQSNCGTLGPLVLQGPSVSQTRCVPYVQIYTFQYNQCTLKYHYRFQSPTVFQQSTCTCRYIQRKSCFEEIAYPVKMLNVESFFLMVNQINTNPDMKQYQCNQDMNRRLY